jgi:cytochrome c biogenesis protein CcmG/thiol:disulfide interchange protein DsbE
VPLTARWRFAVTTRRALLKNMAFVGGALTFDALCTLADGSELRVGRKAPPATLVQLDGTPLSTADLFGEVVILVFWATWCAPCHSELPLLSRYFDEHAAAGLRILGFSLDPPENLTEVRAVAASLSFPVGLLANSSASGYGRILRLPASFTIDRTGRLVSDGWKERSLAWTHQRLAEVVTPLLKR